MYDFYYNYIKKKYNKKAQYSQIQTVCAIKLKRKMCTKIFGNKDKFDFSDFNETSQFHVKTNKKVIDKMKDEAAGQIIKE